MRVLVVEDEKKTASFIRKALQAEGFAVDLCHHGDEALAAAQATPFDGIVLDIMLPGRDGLSVLRQLRDQKNHTPVLLLSARGEVNERVEGLDAGADDYLPKPFAVAELVARTRALLRRPGGALGAVLQAGNIVFNTIDRDVAVDGKPVVLPRRESAILEHLMRRVGRVVPKAVLEDKLYGIDEELESNAIPVHVHHLRRKLTEAGATAEIHTIRGVGYLLSDNSADLS
jgi:DNA-binding response OmpR family regulator